MSFFYQTVFTLAIVLPLGKDRNVAFGGKNESEGMKGALYPNV